MISKPLITVVTVTYNLFEDNRENFFKQCCETVANQTYPNIEHLIIDGASTDGTLELIEKCKHPRMKVISEPDNGLWEAMEKAIYIAKGKYLCYLNSDDYYYNNDVIEKSVEALEKSGADYAISNFAYTDRNDNWLYEYQKNIKPFSKEFVWKGMSYNHETLVCKIDTYKKLGSHNLKYKTCIDYYWNLQLVLNGCNIVVVDQIMFTGRAGGATTTDDSKYSQATIQNVSNLWKDLWDFYPLDDKTCEKMLVDRKYPLEFLVALRKKFIDMKLKNFDYKIFLDDIDEIIKQKEIDELLTNSRLFRMIINFLSIYKFYRFKSTEDRINNYAKKKKYRKIVNLFLSKKGK